MESALPVTSRDIRKAGKGFRVKSKTTLPAICPRLISSLNPKQSGWPTLTICWEHHLGIWQCWFMHPSWLFAWIVTMCLRGCVTCFVAGKSMFLRQMTDKKVQALFSCVETRTQLLFNAMHCIWKHFSIDQMVSKGPSTYKIYLKCHTPKWRWACCFFVEETFF